MTMSESLVKYICQGCGTMVERAVSRRGAMPRYCETCADPKGAAAKERNKQHVKEWRQLNPDKYQQRIQTDNANRDARRAAVRPPAMHDVTNKPVMQRDEDAYHGEQHLINGYPASKYQAAILDEVQRGSGDIQVVAAAGSGKSTTLVEAIRIALRKLEPGQILGLAFNKHIEMELRNKLKGSGVPVQTIHAVGNHILISHLKGESEERLPGPRSDKYRKIVDSWLEEEILRRYHRSPRDVEGYWEWRDSLKEIVDFTRLTLTDADDRESLIRLAQRFGIAPRASGYWIFDGVASILDEGKRLARAELAYDFTDMIWLPMVWQLRMPEIDFITVDEAQDLNALQREFVLQMRAPGGRILWCGDPKQSIMGFAGADVESFNEIQRRTNAKQLPLSISYRCPASHVRKAQALVPTIEARPGAPEGVLEVISEEQLIAMAERGDMIICRRTAPLLGMALKFIASGKPARVRGQEGFDKSLSGLIQLIVKKTRCTFATFETGVNQFISGERRRLEGRENAQRQLETTNDKCQSLLAIYRNSAARTLDELAKEISTIFEDASAAILLSTVHRAKGLEADRVFVLQYDSMPLEWEGQQKWEREQEEHIEYVALTRAKQAMYLIPSPKKEKRDEQRSFFTPEQTRKPWGQHANRQRRYR
jgi:DNA helicase-2/ATP-dependent DNA helicase PcrA